MKVMLGGDVAVELGEIATEVVFRLGDAVADGATVTLEREPFMSGCMYLVTVEYESFKYTYGDPDIATAIDKALLEYEEWWLD